MDQIVAIQIEAPSPVGHQQEEKRGHVLPDIPADDKLAATKTEPQQSKRRVRDQNNHKRDARQVNKAALYQLIEGETEKIESDVDSEEGVQHSKLPAIAEAE